MFTQVFLLNFFQVAPDHVSGEVVSDNTDIFKDVGHENENEDIESWGRDILDIANEEDEDGTKTVDNEKHVPPPPSSVGHKDISNCLQQAQIFVDKTNAKQKLNRNPRS